MGYRSSILHHHMSPVPLPQAPVLHPKRVTSLLHAVMPGHVGLLVACRFWGEGGSRDYSSPRLFCVPTDDRGQLPQDFRKYTCHQ